jgi:predicted regulator of Ras-like GTPase activity (Roadblock/LC7/MglB family)
MKRILIDRGATHREGTRTLVDLLQTEAVKESNRNLIVKSRDKQRGEVRLTNGLVYNISAGNAKGHRALRDILHWDIAEILVEQGSPVGLGVVQECLSVEQMLLEIADEIPILKELTEETQLEDTGMSTIEENIRSILQRMVDRLGGLDGAMLVDHEGFIAASVGSYVGDMHDVEMIGGISTSVLSMTTKMANELNTGEVDRIMIHGDKRHIFVSRAGTEMNMVTVAKRDASLGLIFAELNRVGEIIARTLEDAGYGT